MLPNQSEESKDKLLLPKYSRKLPLVISLWRMFTEGCYQTNEKNVKPGDHR